MNSYRTSDLDRHGIRYGTMNFGEKVAYRRTLLIAGLPRELASHD